jgi:hypothetical protein
VRDDDPHSVQDTRVPPSLHVAGLHLRSARRLLLRRPLPVRGLLAPVDERIVFVVGCPRSGTTFLAACIGSVPGFVDLGEVSAHKALVPQLAALDPALAAPRIRRTLTLTQRLGVVGGARAIEQTPETAFVATAAAIAFPQATFVHIVRDGRDVVCSLLERGWLATGRDDTDDAGNRYGPEARFWVERGREDEFAAASEARRCAWAWRRYVAAARAAPPTVELRYEQAVTHPAAAAAALAAALGAEHERALARALAAGSGSSVGRYVRDLTAVQLAEFEAEAGDLLTDLGYR